jgi:hypothetical protein
MLFEKSSGSRVEVLVVDCPGHARSLLGEGRDRDAVYGLPRPHGETTLAFGQRIARRLASLGPTGIGALSLSVGTSAELTRLPGELSAALGSALAPAGSLTVIGFDAPQHRLFAWLDELTRSARADVRATLVCLPALRRNWLKPSDGVGWHGECN